MEGQLKLCQQDYTKGSYFLIPISLHPDAVEL